jgi:hypothetical protein
MNLQARFRVTLWSVAMNRNFLESVSVGYLFCRSRAIRFMACPGIKGIARLKVRLHARKHARPIIGNLARHLRSGLEVSVNHL